MIKSKHHSLKYYKHTAAQLMSALLVDKPQFRSKTPRLFNALGVCFILSLIIDKKSLHITAYLIYNSGSFVFIVIRERSPTLIRCNLIHLLLRLFLTDLKGSTT